MRRVKQESEESDRKLRCDMEMCQRLLLRYKLRLHERRLTTAFVGWLVHCVNIKHLMSVEQVFILADKRRVRNVKWQNLRNWRKNIHDSRRLRAFQEGRKWRKMNSAFVSWKHSKFRQIHEVRLLERNLRCKRIATLRIALLRWLQMAILAAPLLKSIVARVRGDRWYQSLMLRTCLSTWHHHVQSCFCMIHTSSRISSTCLGRWKHKVQRQRLARRLNTVMRSIRKKIDSHLTNQTFGSWARTRMRKKRFRKTYGLWMGQTISRAFKHWNNVHFLQRKNDEFMRLKEIHRQNLQQKDDELLQAAQEHQQLVRELKEQHDSDLVALQHEKEEALGLAKERHEQEQQKTEAAIIVLKAQHALECQQKDDALVSLEEKSRDEWRGLQAQHAEELKTMEVTRRDVEDKHAAALQKQEDAQQSLKEQHQRLLQEIEDRVDSHRSRVSQRIWDRKTFNLNQHTRMSALLCWRNVACVCNRLRRRQSKFEIHIQLRRRQNAFQAWLARSNYIKTVPKNLSSEDVETLVQIQTKSLILWYMQVHANTHKMHQIEQSMSSLKQQLSSLNDAHSLAVNQINEAQFFVEAYLQHASDPESLDRIPIHPSNADCVVEGIVSSRDLVGNVRRLIQDTNLVRIQRNRAKTQLQAADASIDSISADVTELYKVVRCLMSRLMMKIEAVVASEADLGCCIVHKIALHEQTVHDQESRNEKVCSSLESTEKHLKSVQVELRECEQHRQTEFAQKMSTQAELTAKTQILKQELVVHQEREINLNARIEAAELKLKESVHKVLKLSQDLKTQECNLESLRQREKQLTTQEAGLQSFIKTQQGEHDEKIAALTTRCKQLETKLQEQTSLYMQELRESDSEWAAVERYAESLCSEICLNAEQRYCVLAAKVEETATMWQETGQAHRSELQAEKDWWARELSKQGQMLVLTTQESAEKEKELLTLQLSSQSEVVHLQALHADAQSKSHSRILQLQDELANLHRSSKETREKIQHEQKEKVNAMHAEFSRVTAEHNAETIKSSQKHAAEMVEAQKKHAGAMELMQREHEDAISEIRLRCLHFEDRVQELILKGVSTAEQIAGLEAKCQHFESCARDVSQRESRLRVDLDEARHKQAQVESEASEREAELKSQLERAQDEVARIRAAASEEAARHNMAIADLNSRNDSRIEDMQGQLQQEVAQQHEQRQIKSRLIEETRLQRRLLAEEAERLKRRVDELILQRDDLLKEISSRDYLLDTYRKQLSQQELQLEQQIIGFEELILRLQAETLRKEAELKLRKSEIKIAFEAPAGSDLSHWSPLWHQHEFDGPGSPSKAARYAQEKAAEDSEKVEVLERVIQQYQIGAGQQLNQAEERLTEAHARINLLEEGLASADVACLGLALQTDLLQSTLALICAETARNQAELKLHEDEIKSAIGAPQELDVSLLLSEEDREHLHPHTPPGSPSKLAIYARKKSASDAQMIGVLRQHILQEKAETQKTGEILRAEFETLVTRLEDQMRALEIEAKTSQSRMAIKEREMKNAIDALVLQLKVKTSEVSRFQSREHGHIEQIKDLHTSMLQLMNINKSNYTRSDSDRVLGMQENTTEKAMSAQSGLRLSLSAIGSLDGTVSTSGHTLLGDNFEEREGRMSENYLSTGNSLSHDFSPKDLASPEKVAAYAKEEAEKDRQKIKALQQQVEECKIQSNEALTQAIGHYDAQIAELEKHLCATELSAEESRARETNLAAQVKMMAEEARLSNLAATQMQSQVQMLEVVIDQLRWKESRKDAELKLQELQFKAAMGAPADLELSLLNSMTQAPEASSCPHLEVPASPSTMVVFAKNKAVADAEKINALTEALQQSAAQVAAAESKSMELRHSLMASQARGMELQRSLTDAEARHEALNRAKLLLQKEREEVDEHHRQAILTEKTTLENELGQRKIVHNEELAEVKTQHALVLQDLKEQCEQISGSLQRDLDQAKEQHEQEITGEREKHRILIDGLKAHYEEMTDDLQMQIVSNKSLHQQALRAETQKHQSELDSLEASHLADILLLQQEFSATRSRYVQEIETTNSRHAQDWKEYKYRQQQEFEAHESRHKHEIEGLRQSHHVEVATLKSQFSLDLQSQQDHAKMRIAEIESRYIEGRETVQCDLVNIQSQISELVSELQMIQRSQLEDKEKEIPVCDEGQQSLLVQCEEKHRREFLEMQNKHIEQVQALHAQFAQHRASQLSEHKAEIETVTKTLREQNGKEIERLHVQVEAAEAQISQHKIQHTAECARLMNDLMIANASHARELEELRSKHERQQQDSLEMEHSRASSAHEALQMRNLQQIASLEQQLSEARTKYQELEGVCDGQQRELEQLERDKEHEKGLVASKMAQELKALQDSRLSEIEDLEDRLQKKVRDIEEERLLVLHQMEKETSELLQRKNDEFMRLKEIHRQNLQQKDDELLQAAQEHQQLVRELKEQHDSDLVALQHEKEEALGLAKERHEQEQQKTEAAIIVLKAQHALECQQKDDALVSLEEKSRDEWRGLQAQHAEELKTMEVTRRDVEDKHAAALQKQEDAQQSLKEQHQRLLQEIADRRDFDVRTIGMKRQEEGEEMEKERRNLLQQKEEALYELNIRKEEELLQFKQAQRQLLEDYERDRKAQLVSLEIDFAEQIKVFDKESKCALQAQKSECDAKLQLQEKELHWLRLQEAAKQRDFEHQISVVECARERQLEEQRCKFQATIHSLQTEVQELTCKVKDQDMLVDVLMEEVKVLQQLQAETAEAVIEGQMMVENGQNVQKGLKVELTRTKAEFEEEVSAVHSLQLSLIMEREESHAMFLARNAHDVGCRVDAVQIKLSNIEEMILLLQAAIGREELIACRNDALRQAKVATELRVVDSRSAQRFRTAAHNLAMLQQALHTQYSAHAILKGWRRCCCIRRRCVRDTTALLKRHDVAAMRLALLGFRRLVSSTHKVKRLFTRKALCTKRWALAALAWHRREMDKLEQCSRQIVQAQQILSAQSAMVHFFTVWSSMVSTFPEKREYTQQVLAELTAASQQSELARQIHSSASVNAAFAQLQSSRELDNIITTLQGENIANELSLPPLIVGPPEETDNVDRISTFGPG